MDGQGIVALADRLYVPPTVPVVARIAALNQLAAEGRGVDEVQTVARNALARGLRGAALVWTLGQWTRERLQYANEPDETFWRVPWILSRGVDDCDGYVTLLNALCGAAGIQTDVQWVPISGKTSHVVSLVSLAPGLPFVPYDVTLGGQVGETTAAARLRMFGV
jgi:transglutaminase-like putative cysteine protease